MITHHTARVCSPIPVKIVTTMQFVTRLAANTPVVYSNGFNPDIRNNRKSTAPGRQTTWLSATIPIIHIGACYLFSKGCQQGGRRSAIDVRSDYRINYGGLRGAGFSVYRRVQSHRLLRWSASSRFHLCPGIHAAHVLRRQSAGAARKMPAPRTSGDFAPKISTLADKGLHAIPRVPEVLFGANWHSGDDRAPVGQRSDCRTRSAKCLKTC